MGQNFLRNGKTESAATLSGLGSEKGLCSTSNDRFGYAGSFIQYYERNGALVIVDRKRYALPRARRFERIYQLSISACSKSAGSHAIGNFSFEQG